MSIFAPDSIWTTAIDPAAPLDPNSQAICDYLRSEVSTYGAGFGWSPGVHIYTVPGDQARVPMNLSNHTVTWRADLANRFAKGCPIPDVATPQANKDAGFILVSPDTDEVWEFWQASKDANGVWACNWGGYKRNASSDPGYYRNLVDGRSNVLEHPYWGVSASSLAYVAGVVTLDELSAGVADHAILLYVRNARQGEWVFPAQRSDGKDTNLDAIPEGAHLRLDPALDVAALNLPWPVGMYALAAQKYGIYVPDKTLSGFTFGTQSGATPPPGGGLGKLFPWASVQLLEMDLRTAADKTRYIVAEVAG